MAEQYWQVESWLRSGAIGRELMLPVRPGGALTEFFLEQNCREALLEMEKRWYGPSIEKTGLRRKRLQCHFVSGGGKYSASGHFRL